MWIGLKDDGADDRLLALLKDGITSIVERSRLREEAADALVVALHEALRH